MKTKNLSETLGYTFALNDVIKIIDKMIEDNGMDRFIDGIKLTDAILVGRRDLSVEKDKEETYNLNMIDKLNPSKHIAGEDALFSLNPVLDRNQNKY